MNDIHQAIDKLHKARRGLEKAVRKACPAGKNHRAVQHRDGKPPWCSSCRRTDAGTDVDNMRLVPINTNAEATS